MRFLGLILTESNIRERAATAKSPTVPRSTASVSEKEEDAGRPATAWAARIRSRGKIWRQIWFKGKEGGKRN